MADCTLINLSRKQIVYRKDTVIEHVYFPLTSSICNVVKTNNHPAIGIVQVGSEGMLGATLVLGVRTVPIQAIVQIPGTAMQMDAVSFQDKLLNLPSLLPVTSRYLYALLEQVSQSAACNRFHSVEERLVRWLLVAHDRSESDHFHLTQQNLAEALGVLRSAVTIAAGNLQRQKLISYSRGEIRILDRVRLEAICCECYSIVKAAYDRMIT